MDPNPQLLVARQQLRMQLDVDLNLFRKRLLSISASRDVIGILDTKPNQRLLEALRRHRIPPTAEGIYKVDDIINAVAKLWPDEATTLHLRRENKPKYDATLTEAKRIVSQREASRRYRRKLRFDPARHSQREQIQIRNRDWKANHKESVRVIQRRSRQRTKSIRSLIRAWRI